MCITPSMLEQTPNGLCTEFSLRCQQDSGDRREKNSLVCLWVGLEYGQALCVKQDCY